MKKSLIALAVLAASGAAMAQSSVTLYGVADVAVAKATGTSTMLATNALANNGNSRLGVKGVEDLGGGLKVSFNFEQAVNLGTGATDANTWQRNAFVEVSGGFGSVYAGRRLSPHFYAVATYELTGAANYSAEANQFGFGGGSRNDSMIAYTTPKFSGLSATIGTKLSGNNGGNAKTEFNVIYANGPVAAALGYDKTSGATKSLSLGGSYNFGMATVAASYQDPTGAKKGFTLGASMPLGATTLTADIARDTGSATKSTDYIIEAKYALSKRTFAYGIIHRKGLTGVNTTGVGMRHNF